jgi:hypothetical protein
MLNGRKYTAAAALGVGLAVASATATPAAAHWYGWAGPYYGYTGWPAAYSYGGCEQEHAV